MDKKYKLEPTGFLMNVKGSSGLTIKKLNTFDWLCDLPEAQAATDFVEVQFKNTRKGYYLNSNKLPLAKGDMVAVESSPGHDIGMVTLTGQLVLKQMKKTRYRFDQEVRRVYRLAKPADLEKYEEAKSREHATMIQSRQIAKDLGLDMKIGDVEYQGDGNKAIFYYIADGRVDFRELIKVLADTFHIRIEMKQIGARQEAGRLGGIGPCGREMCCSAWMTNFVSVSTTAARCQDLSLNPQKLAGQCAKLKCCMNYEVDTYMEAQKDFPDRNITLETADATWYPVKNDLFRREITYSTSKDTMANLETIPLERAWEIIHLNREGQKPEMLSAIVHEKEQSAFGDILGSNDFTRFDKPGKGKNRHGHRDGHGGHRPDQRREGNGERHGTNGERRERPQGNGDQSPRREGDNRQGQRREGNQQGQRHEGNGQRREGNGQRREGNQQGQRRESNGQPGEHPQHPQEPKSPAES